jgi:hypothetical protein
VRRLTHTDPLVAHVVKARCAGRFIVEVGDQLAEDPCLIGISDTAIAGLNDSLGDDAPPGEVPQAGASQPAAVDRERGLRRRRGDLIGDRQHAVVALLARDVEIRADLVVLERSRAGLDLDEAGPSLLAALADDRAVGDHGLTTGIFEANLGEGLDDRRLWRPQLLEQCVTELGHRVHDGEQARRGALLLLLLTAYAHNRDQACGMPGLCFRYRSGVGGWHPRHRLRKCGA